MKNRILRVFGILLLFGVCYLLGAVAAELKNGNTEQIVLSDSVVVESQDWGLGFSEKGQPPTGMASVEELKAYDTYFLGNPEEKKIYLTFDAGYENGNTEAILKALEKHQVKATFFSFFTVSLKGVL